ncbi:Cip1-interacting zinc finger protein [Plecturocebus cupreus]
MSQACLLSLLPMPRDILETEDEEPPPRRWCNTCQLYCMEDLIQHCRTQDHKIAKQSETLLPHLQQLLQNSSQVCGAREILGA